MTRPAHIKVHLDAIQHNYRLAKSLAPGAQAIAIIKANAYGHGAVRVARALAADADAFGVACLDEAIQLRQAGIRQRILLLEGFFSTEELAEIDYHRLDMVIHSDYQLAAVLAHQPRNAWNIWLKLETGMHRLGYERADFERAYQQLLAAPQVNEIVFMSHFACADERGDGMTRQQLAYFREVTGQYPQHAISLANSPAVLDWPDPDQVRAARKGKSVRQGEWLRPGMMLYGASPLFTPNDASRQLQAAMTLASRVIALKHLQPGDSIGYGATYRCQRPTRIAVVAMGYGDGYPRHAQNGTPVLVNGQRCPLAGRISMDMLTVDISHLDSVSIGDPVVLWGPDLPSDEVARHCGTIPYELVTRLTARPPRFYD